MSEASPAMAPAAAAPLPDRRPQVEAFLTELLKLMGYPATLDFKEMTDGALGVAVHFTQPDLPGLQGKRSQLVDSMQFLVNKVVNRPNVPRRWVNLGVDAFPEPRHPQQPQKPQAAPAPAAAPAPVQAHAAQTKPGKGQHKPAAAAPDAKPKDDAHAKGKQPERGHGRGKEDERALQVTADPTWTRLGQALADKAAKHGRLYGVMMLSAENRARLLGAVATTKGVTAKAEGEGHWRRLTLTPEKVTPITRKPVMPDYDDEEE